MNCRLDAAGSQWRDASSFGVIAGRDPSPLVRNSGQSMGDAVDFAPLFQGLASLALDVVGEVFHVH